MKTRLSKFPTILLIFVIIISLYNSFNYANNPNEKKILLVYGGWEGHEPEQFKDLLVPWLKDEGYNVTVSSSLDVYADSVFMQNVDLIIQIVTMSKINKEQSDGLLKAVRNGAGITGWHGGLGDSFRENTEYQFMVGGQWVAHPGNIIDYVVNIKNPEDPIVKGITDFEVKTEQYYMHVDPGVDVLAVTKFSGEHANWIDGTVMPVVWKKMYGKGRVFYSSLGHSVSDFNNANTYTIMKRGIKWAIGDIK